MLCTADRKDLSTCKNLILAISQGFCKDTDRGFGLTRGVHEAKAGGPKCNKSWRKF